MVVDQGRQRRLPVIIEAFLTLTEDARDKVTAEVITAIPLSEDLAQSLEQALSQSDQKTSFSKTDGR